MTQVNHQSFALVPIEQVTQGLTEQTALQLTEAINRLTEALDQKGNSKSIYDYELWAMEHIAEHSHYSMGSVYKLIAMPTFPKPSSPLGPNSTKLWEQKAVKQWLLQNHGKLPQRRGQR